MTQYMISQSPDSDGSAAIVCCPLLYNRFQLKGGHEKRVHTKFDPALEEERFDLGGCPFHRLLYS